MEKVFTRPHALTDTTLHYCPGCPHGIVHRLIAEAIDELGIEGRTIGVAPVDLISILQALKKSGSLQAELIII